MIWFLIVVLILIFGMSLTHIIDDYCKKHNIKS